MEHRMDLNTGELRMSGEWIGEMRDTLKLNEESICVP
jgi:hypothetical protein